MYERFGPEYTCTGFEKAADESSSRLYDVAPVDAVQSTWNTPEDWVGTVQLEGGAGGTIVHPVVSVVHGLGPTTPCARTR